MDLFEKNGSKFIGHPIRNIEAISDALRQAMMPEFRRTLESMRNPYGDGNSVARIVEILRKQIIDSDIDIRKSFYNLPFHILEKREI